ncbi:MAG: alpha/beta hydrolase [Actinobacteria bacterium]|nr:alpha/beta hydrolase [Actinomycetota bacterium]MBU1942803.1 alpha/beta hydrolase [Actinomycetota bacterium]MBU2686125.1 alpha/beta hydrolase [Actinomycetota bacterium]
MQQGPDFIDSGEGTALVMIPGMEGAKEFWRFQQEEFDDRYRVVAVSLERRKPSLGSTVEDYAADVLRIMDSLGIDRAVFVGESFGGVISQHVAINHPERVQGLVLCNTMDAPRRMGFGLNMFTLATFVHQFAFLPFLSEETRRRLLRWVGKHRGFVMDPSPGNEVLIDYLFAHGLDCGGAAYLDRMIAGSRARYTERLGEIEAPTLVLRGSEDRLVSADTVLEFLGRIPGAELAMIRGGGHCCQHTTPVPTNAALGDWLARKGL